MIVSACSNFVPRCAECTVSYSCDKCEAGSYLNFDLCERKEIILKQFPDLDKQLVLKAIAQCVLVVIHVTHVFLVIKYFTENVTVISFDFYTY